MLARRTTACFFRSINSGQLRKYHDFQSLERFIKKEVFDFDKRVVDQSVVVTSIKSLIENQRQNSSADSKRVTDLFTRLVESPNVELSNQFIEKVIRELDPSTEFMVQLFKAYNERYPEDFITQDIAQLALRKSIYHKIDLNHALQIVELTTGSKNYIEHLRSRKNMTLFKYFTGGFLGIGALDVALRAFEMNPRLGVYAMCFTYVFNVAAFGFLSFGDRFIPVLDRIEFIQGTSSGERYLHSDEAQMLSKIAEIDSYLNGAEGFVSKNFSEAIQSKGLIPVQPESDLLIQEYWLTGGNNFEWIEPDQDPAEILWRKRVESRKPIPIDDLKWTDKLIGDEATDRGASNQLKQA